MKGTITAPLCQTLTDISKDPLNSLASPGWHLAVISQLYLTSYETSQMPTYKKSYCVWENRDLEQIKVASLWG